MSTDRSNDRVHPGSSGLPRWTVWVAFAAILATQFVLSFQGLADLWVRGHNGWNGAAYHLAARNSLRWDLLFPLQYYTGTAPPSPEWVYTHHPLALHLHSTASLWLFGDHEASIRLVPAINGLLAAIMLLVVVRRFYGDLHAVVAGAIYVLLPINAIYANMANHSTGFIFWSLAAFYCYLRFREVRRAAPAPGKSRRRRAWPWYVGMLGTFLMASSWDWPAYYIAFVMAFHWFGSTLVRQEGERRALRRLGGEILWFAPFCLFVLALFVGHFLLVATVTSGFSDLASTFRERSGFDWALFVRNVKTVPRLMFTDPVLGLCGVWLLAFVLNPFLRWAKARDIIPFAYVFGGLIHYAIFRWSAVVHSYWAWTALPFVAIACASVLIAAGRWLSSTSRRRLGRLGSPRAVRRLSIAIGCSVALTMVPFVRRVVDIVPEGRRVGGSMWFVAPVREVVETYHSGRRELRFAAKVREWTSRRTGVLLYQGFDSLVPEPRFDTTLDREVVRVWSVPDMLPKREGVLDGWVFMGMVAALDRQTRVGLASEYPYWQYGDLFMVDLRGSGRDVRVWRLDPRPMTAGWWFCVNAFEGPVEAVRDAEAESALLAEVQALETETDPQGLSGSPSDQ